MIKSAYEKDAAEWDVIDVDTNQRIPLVQWANDETGEYKVLMTDISGELLEKWCPISLEYKIQRELKKGNIKLVRKSKE